MSQYDCRQQQVSIDPSPGTTDEIRNMHDIFLDPYRCAILHYLQETDGKVSLRKVAFTLEEWSPDGDDAGKADGQQSQAWLRDNHVLPMDEFGVVVYDRDEDAVHLAEDVSFSVTRPWST